MIRHTALSLACCFLALCHPAMAAPPLEVDADFPGGNIRVDSVQGDTITVRADIRDSYWDWFYFSFRVRNAGGRLITVNFAHRDPLTAMGPAVSTDGGANWKWLGAAEVRRHEAPKSGGETNAVSAIKSSFQFRVPDDAKDTRFCVGMPYLEKNLADFLGRNKGHSSLRVESLCKTRKGRDTQALYLGRLDGQAKVRVLIAARHHACEMMASHAVQGIMDTILNDATDGRWLRENVEFLVIPFMDKDGVEDGDQGKNRKPWDHNRDYSGESIYPSVAALRTLASAWSAGKLRLALDLHCPGAGGPANEVIFGLFGSEQIERFARDLESVQTGPLVFRLEDYAPYRNNHLKWSDPTPTDRPHLSFTKWARELPGVTPGLIEIPYATATGRPVTIESATLFGCDLAKAMRRYLEGQQ